MHPAWIIAALVIIAVLAATAIYLHLKLYKQKQRLAEVEREQAENTAKKVQQIQNDIRFLARAYIDDQVELNEASLRIHHLVNYLGLDEQQRKIFESFDAVAREIQNIPTHEEWKSLDKRARRVHEVTFLKLEDQHAEEAKRAALKICQQTKQTYLH